MPRSLFSRSVGKRSVRYGGTVPQGKQFTLFYSAALYSSNPIDSEPLALTVPANRRYSLALLGSMSDPEYFGSVSVWLNGELSYGPVSDLVLRWDRRSIVVPSYYAGDYVQLHVEMPDTGNNSLYAFVGFWRFTV